jgi:thiamine pyrophosphate-dependent acetolactate synthase large subunit-like protein
MSGSPAAGSRAPAAPATPPSAAEAATSQLPAMGPAAPSPDLASTQLSPAEAIVAGLVSAGVREVFGIAGGKFSTLLEAMGREPRLRWTGVRHEAAAAFMATAVAHRTGRPAAAMAEMGPGALNLASGLDSAFTNHLPVIAITMGTPAQLSAPSHGQIMDLDGGAVFAAVTKWRATLAHAGRIPELMARAVRESLTGAPGPVHLEIGYDVLGEPVVLAPEDLAAVGGAAQVGRARADRDQTARAAALLGGARRPLIIAGGGAVASGAEPQVQQLARQLDAPVLVTQMGIGTLAGADRCLVGQGGVVFGESVIRALSAADVVIAIGCRFSSWLWDGMAPAGAGDRGRQLIHLDADPTVIGALVPAAVALAGDARATLEELLPQLDGPPRADPDWRAGLRAEHLSYLDGLAQFGDDDVEGEPMHPAQLARELGRAMPSDALVVYDGAHTSFWSNDLIPVSQSRTRFHDPGSGHLGFGVPYALALSRIEPGSPVVNITGDGAFGFTLAELDTAVRYGLAAVHVIADNQSWGVIAAGQKRLGFELGTELAGTDYAAIARGFGAHGERITAPEEVGPALARALAHHGPAVIDARTRFVPHPGLPRFGAMGRVPAQ